MRTSPSSATPASPLAPLFFAAVVAASCWPFWVATAPVMLAIRWHDRRTWSGAI